MSTTTPTPAQTPAAPETQTPAPETGTKTIPIVQDKRQRERRADWHTPEDCSKLVEFQSTVDDIQKQLKDGASTRATLTEDVKEIKESLTSGSSRMQAIEGSVGSVREIITQGAASHARVEEKLNEQCTVTQLNSVALHEVQAALTDAVSAQAAIAAQGNLNVASLKELRDAQKKDSEGMHKLLVIAEAAEGFLKVTDWLVKAAKPVVAIVVSIVAVYVFLKGGQPK
ncbi:MAG: hypothetical protein K9K35_09980 [Rhodoferax sp.]|nr:hypothetical protein [Rhodoferax sp.]